MSILLTHSTNSEYHLAMHVFEVMNTRKWRRQVLEVRRAEHRKLLRSFARESAKEARYHYSEYRRIQRERQS